VLIICAAAPLFALDDFVQNRLILAWRRFLTDSLMTAFFSNEAYYRIIHMGGIDNPDQRITQDVAAFVESSTSIISILVSKIFNCIAFAGVSLSFLVALALSSCTRAKLALRCPLPTVNAVLHQLCSPCGLETLALMRYLIVPFPCYSEIIVPDPSV
jgi:ABC-type uncharacterized transport system fused permease/ATPase subunit